MVKSDGRFFKQPVCLNLEEEEVEVWTKDDVIMLLAFYVRYMYGGTSRQFTGVWAL